ncbi:ABC transporter ATP-binding protein [Cryobacterium sp. Sr8]|uniref:Molybdate transport system ATP-binding protein n=1 Tax=Cryobacterium psychrotolerans TaxID=386301 RepID=A0A1G8XF73_9MICO|nr:MULTISPECIES: ABC transporter ATP-binding protein [Cryobacterium]TFD45721.1 ABC transporter ATP-binding protein [Cryobacterium sp. TMT1-2-1]TFD82289.1 ABC transporter ATP-binding protein [Cryobacterium sp. Sr8]TFD82936.1 ABC transporter ATP-binding protein [Cryobacterium psychrotolerans]SDJ89076.1 molybdate transport system ATP-binding protein [Cryobacterium psychrotolerans]
MRAPDRAGQAALEALVLVERDGFRLDVRLTVPSGGVLAVLGPNGAGKTTLLRALAGLIVPNAGRVRVGDRILDDPAAGIHLEPQARGIGVVFQDYLLFPHLSALDNVAFGPRAHGVPAREARERSQAWLTRVGIGDRAGARPAALSGGQSQRAALARALVLEPSVLLLDEPLAALDAATRMDVRADLSGYLREFGGATVLVTHDPLDALILADEIIVLEAGVVTQRGTPQEVSRAPRTDYVARLVGQNLLRAASLRGLAGGGSALTLAGGLEVSSADEPSAAGMLAPGSAESGPGQSTPAAVFSPSAVFVHSARPGAGSPRNVWAARVAGIEQHAAIVRIRCLTELGGHTVLADVTPAAMGELRLRPGDQVWLSVKAVEVHLTAAA